MEVVRQDVSTLSIEVSTNSTKPSQAMFIVNVSSGFSGLAILTQHIDFMAGNMSNAHGYIIDLPTESVKCANERSVNLTVSIYWTSLENQSCLIYEGDNTFICGK